MYGLLGVTPFNTPLSLGLVDRLLGVLVAGVRAGRCAWRVVASHARGYTLAEVIGFTIDAARPAGRERLAGLGAYDFPILASRSEELVALDADSS